MQTHGTTHPKEKQVRVAIAGAGSVGRSIADVLLEDDHRVLLIERQRPNYRPDLVPKADWLLADACELANLQRAGIDTCDVVVAAAGDDKANLVFALLAKTQCGVPRVVARVNDATNRWLFDSTWGVDVAVSTPSALVSLVEEAVTVGDVVQLMTLQQGHGNIVAVTLPADAALTGSSAHAVARRLPGGVVLAAVRRGVSVLPPDGAADLAPGDELVLVAPADSEDAVRLAVLGV
jgi:trk system potassium uptake protein TrkA